MLEPRELRTAVIGLGKLGLLHAATFNVLPGCRLVAVADKSKTVRDGLKAHMESVETYADYEKLLDATRPDLVAVATPTGLHVAVYDVDQILQAKLFDASLRHAEQRR